jgi:hypothetical protein
MKTPSKKWNTLWNTRASVPVERGMEHRHTKSADNPRQSSRSTGTPVWNVTPVYPLERSTHSLKSGTWNGVRSLKALQ